MHALTTLVARQPILDQDLRTVAYEILFRSERPIGDGHTSPEFATGEVGVQALLDIGLDRLVGRRRAWINVPRGILVSGMWEFFPPERVVLELLETVEADPEVLESVQRARSMGYEIALDDFVPTERTSPLLSYCDYVKLDVLGRTEAELEPLVKSVRGRGRRLLAEKVETHEMFELSRRMECSLFQGYFFSRPKAITGRRLPNNRMVLLRVAATLQDERASMEQVEELVRADLGLSYRLLRYVNSAAVGLLAPIDSLRHAIMTLGTERVRACIMVLLLTGREQRPDELITISLVRARFCQLLARMQGLDPGQGFLVGLLSSIDAFLERDMTQLVQELGLADDLAHALCRREGPLGTVLQSAIACESAAWDSLAELGLDSGPARDTYLQAIDWSTHVEGGLSAGK